MLRWLIAQLEKYHVEPLEQLVLSFILSLVSYGVGPYVEGVKGSAIKTIVFVVAAMSSLVGLYRLLEDMRKQIGVRLDQSEAKLLGGLSAVRASKRAIPETGLEVALGALAGTIVEAHDGGKYPFVEDLEVNIVLAVLDEESEFERFHIHGDLRSRCSWFRFRIQTEWTMRPSYRGVEEVLSLADVFGPIIVTQEETLRELIRRGLLEATATVFWPVSAQIAQLEGFSRLSEVRFLRDGDAPDQEGISVHIAKYDRDSVVAECVGAWVFSSGGEVPSALEEALRGEERLTRSELGRVERAVLQTYNFACDNADDVRIRVMRGHQCSWKVNHRLDYVLPMKVLSEGGGTVRDNRLYTHPFSKATSLSSMTFRSSSPDVRLTSTIPPFVHCILGDVAHSMDGVAWHIGPQGACFLPGDEISFLWSDTIVEERLKAANGLLEGVRRKGGQLGDGPALRSLAARACLGEA